MAYNTGFDLFTYLLAKQNAGGGGGGSGANFQSLTINNDGTITIVDVEGATHTLVPTYDSNNVMTAITYDDKNIPLVYDDNGYLIKVGNSDIDIGEYTGVAEAVLATLLTLTSPAENTLDSALAQLETDRQTFIFNLSEKGVEAQSDDTITDLVPLILDISGGGISVTDLTYDNDTGVYTVTDANGDTHTFSIIKTDGEITGATYDDINVPLIFDAEGNLIKIGDVDIDISEYPNLASIQYGSLTLNQDGTFSIVDEEGNSHTVELIEEDGEFVGAVYDGSNIPLTFDANGELIKIGNSDIDVDLFPSEPSGGAYSGVSVIPIQSIDVTASITIS